MTMGEINHPEWYPPSDPVQTELERRIAVRSDNVDDALKSIDHLAVVLRKQIEAGNLSNVLMTLDSIRRKGVALEQCDTELRCYKAALKLIENTRTKGSHDAGQPEV